MSPVSGTLPGQWNAEGNSFQGDPLVLALQDTGITGPLPDSWGTQMANMNALWATNASLSGGARHTLARQSTCTAVSLMLHARA